MLTKHDRNQAPSSLKQLKAFEDYTGQTNMKKKKYRQSGELRQVFVTKHVISQQII
jgi:hypothetical protein